MARAEPHEGTSVRVDSIGGVMLITPLAEMDDASSRRLATLLDHARRRRCPVVIDLSAPDGLDAPILEVLRAGWISLGDQLRVVALPGSVTADDLKRAGLRRFAIHATLSGALALAGRT